MANLDEKRLNQGPEPKILFNQNGVRYIDPNPTDQIVNHEDLVMYVKLVARNKGRSILTSQGTVTVAETELRNVKGETNFTYPTGQNYIDTSWTNAGGGNLNLGEDLGTFGITNIDIQFKSSFMPQITIDFVDVRGTALFEQGPCSPYSMFFHLPYPVFELTVKGYYGKPVTYTLALVKFNTKFNAETGNFESKGEFVGYTYAFLADLPLGYIMAPPYMKRGPEVKSKKWQNITNRPEFKDTYYGLNPQNPITIFDLILKSKKLETEVPKLKDTTEVKEVTRLAKARDELTNVRQEIINYQRKVLNAIGTTGGDSGVRNDGNGNKNRFFIRIPQGQTSSDKIKKFSDVNKLFISPTLDEEGFKSGLISGKLETAKAYLELAQISTIPEIKFSNIKAGSSGFFGSTIQTAPNNNSTNEWYVDTYESMLKPIDEALKSIDKNYKQKKEKVQEQLNRAVREILEFWPSIRNIFVILTTDAEVFLELLAETSVEAEDYHEQEEFSPADTLLELRDSLGAELSNENKTGTNKEKVYPWPTYYEKQVKAGGDTGDSGEKETYPGENVKFAAWPEVTFVEEFVDALTQLREDLEVLEIENVDNEPGFDNFAPITAYETHGMGLQKAPCRWYKIQNGIDGVTSELLASVYCMMGENAMLLGDYSMINSLSVWKSQLGFTNSWGFDFLSNGTTDTNGHTINQPPDTALTAKPHRLKDNPIVTANLNTNKQLGRYNNKGMPFDNARGNIGDKTVGFKGKISPTTKWKMREWGKIDAINLLQTMSSDGQVEVLTLLKSLDGISKENLREKIKSGLKEKYSTKFKTQTFDQWKVDATAAIGGTKALVDQQSNIWKDYYSYVKSNNVLTLSSGIKLTYTEGITDEFIYANPYKNEFQGVRLAKIKDIEGRNMDFSDDDTVLKPALRELYYKIYGRNGEAAVEDESSDTAIDEGGTDIDGNSLSFRVLTNKPLFQTKGSTALATPSDGQNTKLDVQKNLNMLHYDIENFKGNFYHNYEDHANKKLSDGSGVIFDLGSARQVYCRDYIKTYHYKDWSNFTGSANISQEGAGDALVQTPLWTLNYPPYKNPWLASYEMILHEENIQSKRKTGKKTCSLQQETESKTNNDAGNQTRNYATWWGLNQYYTDPNEISTFKYVLPLAYLAVMSFGFEPSNKGNGTVIHISTGHVIPYDGTDSGQMSSFTNFTHQHVAATPPRAWLLLLGSILWRLKEGHALIYEQEIELEPTHRYKGWNRNQLIKDRKLFITADSSNPTKGIVNDLDDPVWFFHNSISKPWWKGGCVYAVKANSSITDYNGNTYDWKSGPANEWNTPMYVRRYMGVDSAGMDRWTESGGGYIFYSTENGVTSRPRVIGTVPVGPNSFTDYNAGSGVENNNGYVYSYCDEPKDRVRDGYYKSHHLVNAIHSKNVSPARSSTKLVDTGLDENPILRGLFDCCRVDQVPFLKPSSEFAKDFNGNELWYKPQTLVITDLSTERGRVSKVKEDNFAVPYATPNNYSNEYIKIKEQMKELAFLPSKFKIALIDQFVDWATSSNSAFANSKSPRAGWLKTLDPLNWQFDIGLELYGLGKSHTQWGSTTDESAVDFGIQYGYNGWLGSTNYTKRMVDGTLSNSSSAKPSSKSGGGYFDGSDKKYNIWYNAYGLDNNWART